MIRITSFFFLAALFTCTFFKVQWQLGVDVSLADVLSLGFLLCFAIVTRPRFPRTGAVLLVFFAAFLVVRLFGFYNLETAQALDQFTKGMLKFVIQFSFLATGVVWLYHRGRDYYWRALGWFCGGIAVNAAYGLVQLLVARSGGNLDAWILHPITGGASKINVYGAVDGASVFRINALTGDANHLGIMLVVPLLVLTPIYLRLERGHRLKRRLGLLIALLLLAEVGTLSRSGALGLAVGALVLASPYRHYLRSKALLAPLGAAFGILAVVVLTRLDYFEVVLRSRLPGSGKATQLHINVYSFVPDVLQTHPLFGLGLNNFSVYYEWVTGKTNWGPHSFYVALLVETGLVGTVLFAVFLGWVFARLGAARRLGRSLVLQGNPLGRRVRPLAWGCTAALAGTMAANVFYLTMQFYYFYAVLTLALAIPLVFGQSRLARSRAA